MSESSLLLVMGDYSRLEFDIERVVASRYCISDRELFSFFKKYWSSIAVPCVTTFFPLKTGEKSNVVMEGFFSIGIGSGHRYRMLGASLHMLVWTGLL